MRSKIPKIVTWNWIANSVQPQLACIVQRLGQQGSLRLFWRSVCQISFGKCYQLDTEALPINQDERNILYRDLYSVMNGCWDQLTMMIFNFLRSIMKTSIFFLLLFALNLNQWYDEISPHVGPAKMVQE